jgi:hypothetical protein
MSGLPKTRNVILRRRNDVELYWATRRAPPKKFESQQVPLLFQTLHGACVGAQVLGQIRRAGTTARCRYIPLSPLRRPR